MTLFSPDSAYLLTAPAPCTGGYSFLPSCIEEIRGPADVPEKKRKAAGCHMDVLIRAQLIKVLRPVAKGSECRVQDPGYRGYRADVPGYKCRAAGHHMDVLIWAQLIKI